MTPEAPIVEARGLARRFGRVTVFRDLDLTVGPGELWLVAGRNGSGKSTLLRVLAGLLAAQAGTVRIGGVELDRRDPETRRGIGYVAHETMLYDDLTLRENLVFAARCHDLAMPSTIAAAGIDVADLGPRADDLFRSLSRGMRQRAAVARALLHSPLLLLLDEPFTGLDSHSAAALRRQLVRHRDAGGSALVVTHQASEVWSEATHAALLAGGNWAFAGPKGADVQAFEHRCREQAG
jgi:heme ABC exporter ATP-binding subunit CcmA